MKMIYSPFRFILCEENSREREKLEQARCGQPFRMEDGCWGLHFNYPSENEKMIRVLQRVVGAERTERILRQTGLFPVPMEKVVFINTEG